MGDPTNPKVWSGTPYNLYIELKKKKYIENVFSSKAFPDKYSQFIIHRLNSINYNHSIDLSYGFLPRYLNAYKVNRETQASKSKITLHSGSLDLPFYKLPKNQSHYLLIDSTWNAWSSQTQSLKGFSQNLIEDAEFLAKKAYSQVKHIFSISEYIKNNLIEHYNIPPNKITVVGTGLGIIEPYYGRKDYSNGQLLFAAKGRFEDKGGLLVLKAFDIALKRNPKLQLTIVGQNDYKEKIKNKNIKTYGFIPLNDLQNLFNENSIFIMPALNEQWGLVYLEALACKMPVLGLNRNGFPEISDYGNYGFGIDDTNPESLAELIVGAFEKPLKLEEIGLNAQKYCLSKYTWETTANKIITKIEELEK